MKAPRKRVAILISGRGSNMSALIDAAREPGYPAEIVGVISDRTEAPGLAIATAAGIGTTVIARKGFVSSEAHDEAIDNALKRLDAEIVCLAGYMRLLGPSFVHAWSGRMINIHPSLLPSFRGLNTHRRALDAGSRIHGCTVHFVSVAVDDGPIIAQAAVPVLTDDSEPVLAARVLKAEHQLYAKALSLLASGKVRLENARVRFDTTGLNERNSRQSLHAPEFSQIERSIEDLARITP